jgi:UDP-N-acetylmuramoyl-L-alanyl-D-glutamate--2,6-diaminopimelate ligase
MMATLSTPGFDAAALVARLSVVPRGITADSRLVRPGEVFAAYRGQAADGRAFIPDAIARGADAVLWDAFGFRWNPAWEIANVAVDDLKKKLGAIAAFIYGNPAQSLWIAGVTGTNGKTSCAHWIAAGLDAAGRRAAVLGTLGNGLDRRAAAGANTTRADAALVHATLAQMRDAGARSRDGGLVACARSGSRQRCRVRRRAVHQSTAIISTTERWRRTGQQNRACSSGRGSTTRGDQRRRPVRPEPCRSCTGPPAKVLTYGLVSADIVATAIGNTQAGIRMSVDTPWGSGDVSAQVARTFNAANMLGVLGVLLAGRIALDDALAALRAHHGAAGSDAATRRRIHAARRCRLRAFARRARKGVDRVAADGRRRRRVDLRIRMRRRSRRGQAPGYGQDRGAPGRPRDRHQR